MMVPIPQLRPSTLQMTIGGTCVSVFLLFVADIDRKYMNQVPYFSFVTYLGCLVYYAGVAKRTLSVSFDSKISISILMLGVCKSYVGCLCYHIECLKLFHMPM
jgi:hypothetical protein